MKANARLRKLEMLAAAERAAGGPRIPLAAIRAVLSEKEDDDAAVVWAMQRIRDALAAAAPVEESLDADGSPRDM